MRPFLLARVCVGPVLFMAGVVLAEAPLPTAGVNLSYHAYWEPSFPFVDVAKMDQDWHSTDGVIWDDQRPLALGETGYPASLLPGQIARALIFTHNGAMYPTGLYRLRWDGTGDVVLRGDYQAVDLVEQVDHGADYNVVEAGNMGLLLDIVATDPADPVRNISVVPAVLEDAATPFNPRYLDDVAPYGVLRFMNWNATNIPASDPQYQVSSWSQRSRLDSANWGWFAGIPYEMQIELSNTLHQDMWLNIPHLADDDYVRNLAQLVKEQLDPDLRVWVEYTNEAWNGIYPQNEYINNVLAPQYGVGGYQAYALRAAEIFDIFEQYVPEAQLNRVLSGLAATSYVLEQGLIAVSGPQGTHADVAAVAAYFGLTPEQTERLYTEYLAGNVNRDQVFADLRGYIDDFAQRWQDNRRVAASYGLPLVAYEAGQHLVAFTVQQRTDEGFIELLASFQNDPRMGELYDYLTQKWQEIGGSTIVFFDNLDTWSRDGFWGLRDNFYETDSVKFQAVRDFLREFPGGYDPLSGRLRGDFDADAQLDVQDIDRLTAAIRAGTGDLLYDLNQDGQLSGADRQYWLQQLKRSAMGDANLDRAVDSNDLVQVFQAGRYEDGVAGNASWATGDWDGNGEFDSGDLIAVMQEGHYGEGPLPTVPEPSAGWLVGLAIAGWLRWVRAIRP